MSSPAWFPFVKFWKCKNDGIGVRVGDHCARCIRRKVHWFVGIRNFHQKTAEGWVTVEVPPPRCWCTYHRHWLILLPSEIWVSAIPSSMRRNKTLFHDRLMYVRTFLDTFKAMSEGRPISWFSSHIFMPTIWLSLIACLIWEDERASSSSLQTVHRSYFWEVETFLTVSFFALECTYIHTALTVRVCILMHYNIRKSTRCYLHTNPTVIQLL